MVMKEMIEYKKVLTINLDSNSEYADFKPYTHREANPRIYVSERKIEITFRSGNPYAVMILSVIDRVSISWEEKDHSVEYLNTYIESGQEVIGSYQAKDKGLSEVEVDMQMRMLESESEGINNIMAQDMAMSLFHKLISTEFMEKYMPKSYEWQQQIKRQYGTKN
jgi:hypothetical protein